MMLTQSSHRPHDEKTFFYDVWSLQAGEITLSMNQAPRGIWIVLELNTGLLVFYIAHSYTGSCYNKVQCTSCQCISLQRVNRRSIEGIIGFNLNIYR